MKFSALLNMEGTDITNLTEIEVMIDMYTSLSKERGISLKEVFKLDDCKYKYNGQEVTIIFDSYLRLEDENIAILLRIFHNGKMGVVMLSTGIVYTLLIEPKYTDIEVINLDCYVLVDEETKTCLFRSKSPNETELTDVRFDTHEIVHIPRDKTSFYEFDLFYDGDTVVKSMLSTIDKQMKSNSVILNNEELLGYCVAMTDFYEPYAEKYDEFKLALTYLAEMIKKCNIALGR